MAFCEIRKRREGKRRRRKEKKEREGLSEREKDAARPLNKGASGEIKKKVETRRVQASARTPRQERDRGSER